MQIRVTRLRSQNYILQLVLDQPLSVQSLGIDINMLMSCINGERSEPMVFDSTVVGAQSHSLWFQMSQG